VGNFDIVCWRKMELISWTDKVKTNYYTE